MKLLLGEQAVKEASSNADGAFTFDALSAGRYRIEASSPGFQTRTSDPMFVSGSGRVSIELALPIGPLEQNVSVTAAATSVLPSQIAASVTVIDSATLDTLGKPDVLEALRLVPGAQVVQAGQRGGVTSLFVRGGASNFNKVLIDGVAANDIGGGFDFSSVSVTGVDSVEVLREANSVIYGSDSLSGVVSITTRRGRTRVPEFTYAIDGGNLGTMKNDVAIAGASGRFDYFSDYSYFTTDNDVPNNEFTNGTYAGPVQRGPRPRDRPERHDPARRHELRQPERDSLLRGSRRFEAAGRLHLRRRRGAIADQRPVAEHDPVCLDGAEHALHQPLADRHGRSIPSGSAPTTSATR